MSIPVVTWWDENSNAWDDVWASDFFKALARTPSWLSEHVVPLLKKQQIGWITPPENSRFYFSAWFMNCVMRREYDNKIIQDLYILHEALHAATIDNYFKESDNLFHALRVNEIEVSLETEAWIYLRHPEILGKTFDPLWVLQKKTKTGPLHDWRQDEKTITGCLPKTHLGPSRVHPQCSKVNS